MTVRTRFEIYSVEKGCAEFVWSSEFVWKGGEYEDFSIIAGDSKRSLLQQLEMSYYCIVLRTDLTIFCVKFRLFLHVFINHTDKKDNQIFLIYIIRKFRVEQLQSHI